MTETGRARRGRDLGDLSPLEAEAVAAGLCRLAPYGCDGELLAATYCGAHYSRVKRNGDPGDPVVKRRRRRVVQYVHRTSRKCDIAGCGRPHHADGLCGGHYSRKQLTGDPGTEPIKEIRSWRPPAPLEAIEVALELAGGDWRRVTVAKDGTIDVAPHRPSGRPSSDGRPGRPPAFDEAGLQKARQFLADHPELTDEEAAAALDISRPTLAKYFPQRRGRSPSPRR